VPPYIRQASVANFKNKSIVHNEYFLGLISHDDQLNTVGSIIKQISRYMTARPEKTNRQESRFALRERVECSGSILGENDKTQAQTCFPQNPILKLHDERCPHVYDRSAR
jgi:hypothetical protein